MLYTHIVIPALVLCTKPDWRFKRGIMGEMGFGFDDASFTKQRNL